MTVTVTRNVHVPPDVLYEPLASDVETRRGTVVVVVLVPSSWWPWSWWEPPSWSWPAWWWVPPWSSWRAWWSVRPSWSSPARAVIEVVLASCCRLPFWSYVMRFTGWPTRLNDCWK